MFSFPIDKAGKPKMGRVATSEGIPIHHKRFFH